MRFSTRAILLLVSSLIVAPAIGQTTDTPTIPEDSCGDPTSCQNNDVETLQIADLACNGQNSCSSNTGSQFNVGSGGCNVSATKAKKKIH